MPKRQRRCRHCRVTFEPLRNPNQHYCAKSDCQKMRRRRWRNQKYKKDADYLANKKRSQQTWHQRNPDYYRRYRKANPDYATRNKMRQKERNHRNRPKKSIESGERITLAKMNALLIDFPFISIGCIPFAGQNTLIAKMNVLMQEMQALSMGYRCFDGKFK